MPIFKRSTTATSLSTVMASLALLAAPLITSVTFASAEPEIPVLSPESVHKKTLKAVVKSLRLGHYSKVQIDDEFSSELLDSYLDQLDPNRLYFMASDVAEFERYRTSLDNALREQNLAPAFSIYNRMQQRTQERLHYLLRQIDAGLERLDFNRAEALNADRKQARWASNLNEMDDLWRKRLKSTVLNLKLSNKTLAEIEGILKKRYENQALRLSQATSEDAFQAYTNTLSRLYGPHTQYFSPRRSENFNIDMRLSLEGIGAVLQAEYENTKIVRLIPAGPAEKSGLLHPADIIVGVAQGDAGEMIDVVGWRLDEVVNLIRGPKQSVVRLSVIAAGSETGIPKEVRIVRNQVKLEEQAAKKRIIELDYLGKQQKVGVIDIPTFYIDFDALRNGDKNYRSTTRDVEKLLQSLIADNVEGVIIDLRNNGGGALREAIDLAGLFIPKGPVVQIKDTFGRIRIEYDQDPTFYDIPLVVLVNRLSASASEIFAGAMQDYNRGLVLGSQTYGKGTVQVLQPLSHGQLKLTRAKFYRVSGDSTQHKGVIPDIELPSLYDPEQIGESTADRALPWDQVAAVPHTRYPAINPFTQQLRAVHASRITSEPDFAAIQEQITYSRERRKNMVLPLQEDALKTMRSSDEQWRLDLENRRRAAKSEPLLGSFADLEKHAAKVEGHDEGPDAILKESSYLLLDLLSLSNATRVTQATNENLP